METIKTHPSGMSVELLHYMGTDLDIVNNARVSYGKESHYEYWRWDKIKQTFISSPTRSEIIRSPGEPLDLSEYFHACLSSRDSGILNYMMREKHGSPFEAVVFRFRVHVPLAVGREWMRHRIGCLSGDTRIPYVGPSGKVMSKPIRDLYELKYGGTTDQPPVIKNGLNKRGQQAHTKAKWKVPNRRRVLPNCQERVFRSVDEATGTIGTEQMADIWESGIQGIYLLKTTRGKEIKATENHMFLTSDGWKPLKLLSKGSLVATTGLISMQERQLPPRLREGIGLWTTSLRTRLIEIEDICYLCGAQYPRDQLALDHVVPVAENIKLALDQDNLKPCCYSCHRKKTNSEQSLAVRKTGLGIVWDEIEFDPFIISREMTYDIETVGPNHNYEANGFIVHNSFNEISTRYVELEKEYYTPELEDWRTQVGKPGHYEFVDMTVGNQHAASVVYEIAMEQAFGHYDTLLKFGVAKEIARNVLPLGSFTTFIWTVNLRSLFNFLVLRTAIPALREIRIPATMVEDLAKEVVPESFNAWYRHNKHTP